MALTLVTAATSEPVGLDSFKDHARIDTDDQDVLISDYIRSAREWVEKFTRRQMLTATWRLTLDVFPDTEIAVPWPPLQSVTSITYTNTAGTADVAWSGSNYVADTDSTPGRIRPIFGETWPDIRHGDINTVKITFVAGYTSTANTPGPMLQAVRLLASHSYEQREPILIGPGSKEMEFTVSSLLYPYRIPKFA
jgi:uncharacterized phiE125 gp8 family phage protein